MRDNILAVLVPFLKCNHLDFSFLFFSFSLLSIYFFILKIFILKNYLFIYFKLIVFGVFRYFDTLISKIIFKT
jgi:hypothetical protein